MPQHIQPIDVLIGVAGHSNADLETLVMDTSEGTRRAFACLEATIVLGPVLIPVGGDRHHAGRRPGNESSDAAGRECRSHDDLAGPDLGPVCEGERGSGLDAFRDDEVARRRWIAPEHRATGSALPGRQLGRLLRVARMSVRASAELGFAGAASGDIDTMGVLADRPARWCQRRCRDGARPASACRPSSPVGRSRAAPASRPPGSTASPPGPALPRADGPGTCVRAGHLADRPGAATGSPRPSPGGARLST